MTASQDELIGQEEVGKGPGARLREARERAGLGVEDVAAQLHLDRHTVDGLEADNFDRLPAPTFVRGYLRAYARLLDLPHAPIIEAFDRRGLAPPALIADIATGQEARSTDLPMRVATYGIVALLIALAVVWWRNQRVDEGVDPMTVMQSPTTGAQDNAESSETKADAPVPTTGDQPSVAAAPDKDSRLLPPPDTSLLTPPSAGQEMPAVENAPAATDAATANTQTGVDQQTARMTANTEKQTTDTQAASSPVALNAAGADAGRSTLQPPADTPSETEARAPAGATGRVVLRFKADSWVEIHDGSDKRLYFNLAKAGQRIDVNGPQPLRVLIGYIEGVEMEYNGQPYDFSGSVRKGVARFEVGAN